MRPLPPTLVPKEIAETIAERLVLRLLINLSAGDPRTLSYADVDPASVRIHADGGYPFCRGRIPETAVNTVTLPPRRGRIVAGVLLQTNRVLHAGADGEHGHFVAAYGRDQASR